MKKIRESFGLFASSFCISEIGMSPLLLLYFAYDLFSHSCILLQEVFQDKEVIGSDDDGVQGSVFSCSLTLLYSLLHYCIFASLWASLGFIIIGCFKCFTSCLIMPLNFHDIHN